MSNSAAWGCLENQGSAGVLPGGSSCGAEVSALRKVFSCWSSRCPGQKDDGRKWGLGEGGRLLFLFAWTRIEGKGCCLGDESSCCKGLGDNDKEVLTQNLALRRAERILMRWKRCCWQYV